MKTVGILAFGALLIVTFGYVTIFGDYSESTVELAVTDTQPIAQEVPDNTEINERDQFTGSDTIRSLYERGDSLECQITYIPNPLEASITGNIFMADGRVRGDFVVPAPDLNGQTVASII